MITDYEYKINIVNFDHLGYLKIVANIHDKHDRSAPSNYHWKILKCRMLIFSAPTLMACPDKSDVKKIHVLFNKTNSDYDCLTSLFSKLSLCKDGAIDMVTEEIYLMCFNYTMSAKLAPAWNVLGYNYFIHNRDFLTTCGLQEGIKYTLTINHNIISMKLKPVKINLVKSREKFTPGEYIRVLPSLNKAVIEDCFDTLPELGAFKCFKDLRRHWKNIHGYRLPSEEYTYSTVRFWRGEPLIYPDICLIKSYPIIIPIPKSAEILILSKFINSLKHKMPYVLGSLLQIEFTHAESNVDNNTETLLETQAVSLCTPTQQ